MNIASKYLSHVYDILRMLEQTQMEALKVCAQRMRETIMSGHSIYIFGASHAGILTQEMFYRAGGLALVNPIFAKEVSLDVRPVTQTSQMERLAGYGTIVLRHSGIEKGDLLFIHSVSGRNTIALDMAAEAKRMGAFTIGITNVGYSKQVTSRHPSGKKLYEVVDHVIDNCGDYEDASMELKGLQQKVAPTSTIAGAAILHMLTLLCCEAMLENGETPPILHSANVDGGDRFNEDLLRAYREQIHYM